ncbi:MAG: xylulokinase [Acidimicrobiales bacterium]|nr:xylulokinase [Acidimicrobiales bacterium]
MPLVCGVDSSTQSTKVELRDADTGVLVATGRAPHPATTPPRSEQHPAAWWGALGAAVAGCRRAADVAAVAVAGQQHGLVVTDAAGVPLRPAKLWNDTESAPQAEVLVAGLGGPARWAALCGSVPVASFTVTKLAWLRQHEPEVLARAAWVLLPHDWLTRQLCGAAVTDRGDASGTGYWSPASGRYLAEVLALVDPEVDWRPRLPEVLGPVDVAGAVGAAAAAAVGLRAGVLVGPGTGDNMAAALGVALQPGDVVVSIGTSGTVYAVSPTPTADGGGAVAGFADATGRFLPLVCTLNATKVTDAAARLLGVDLAGLDALARAGDPGAGGLVLLPYLDGERTPNRPGATGVLAGLRSDVTREQLARAAVEGVVCGLLDGLDALRAAGVDTGGRLVLVGGGSRSAAYPQILGDLAGRAVTVAAGAEHVAAGACVQAAAVLHGRPPEEVAVAWGLGHGPLVEPGPGAAAGPEVRAAYGALRDATARAPTPGEMVSWTPPTSGPPAR